MSLLYPLGLIALVGIPILIIIYIIKNRYTEQVISSTYLWTLSEKFLKRRNPLKRITGLLSLILQMLIVALIALSIAQPVFVRADAAEDYLFVIDGSASMNMTRSDGKTRMEEAKSQVESMVKNAVNGSTYTLVYASDTTAALCSGTSDKNAVYIALNQIDEGYCGSNLSSALYTAQSMFDENPALKVYLYTDKDYSTAGTNVTCVNLSYGEENYAVSDISYTISDGNLFVTGSAWSYESAATLDIALYINGSSSAVATTSVDAEKLQAQSFALEAEGVASFSSFTVEITSADSFAQDNACTIYSAVSGNTYDTLVVYDADSDTTNEFFIKAILSIFGDISVEVVSSSKYTGQMGYGLYIFDGYVPSVLPDDGAVWFIDPDASVSNSGFSVQNTVEYADGAHGKLTYSTSTATRVQTLLSGITDADLYVKNYVKCGFTRDFSTLLYCGSDPVLFAGTNSYGNRQVVFAFDFHDSNFVMGADYVQLMYNLFTYTFPEVVSSTLYYCGDTVDINIPSSCDDIRVTSPSGAVSYPDISGETTEVDVTETGTYTIAVVTGTSQRDIQIYVCVPLEERYTTASVAEDGAVYVYDGATQSEAMSASGAATEVYFTITGDAAASTRDGIFDELWVWLVALAVIFIADWGVYCYEQYQLR